MKILFTITTGRSDFKETLDLMSKNFKNFDHFSNHEIGLVINYDCSFLGLSDDDFKYDNEYAKLYKETIYLGQKHVDQYARQMEECGIEPEIAQTLSQATGYSNKKNLVYLEAIKKEYDIVLFWDDDEYPVICNLSGESINWVQSDILGAHISAYEKYSADVAFGFFTGYASPIPLNLDKKLSIDTAKYLGDALAVASDVVDPSTFIKTDKIFIGSNEECLETKEIEFVDGGKWISGGNLSVKVSAVIKGVVPPYYAPSGTRADDTVLSMNLKDARVIQVPAGIFHDAFGEYKSIRLGILPNKIIRNDKVDEIQVERFCGALKGWFGYAPIFLRIRYMEKFEKYAKDMLDKTKLIDNLLFDSLPEAKRIFNKIKPSNILKNYIDSAEDDFKTMNKCYEEWKKISKKIYK
jgi:hypothetical protein